MCVCLQPQMQHSNESVVSLRSVTHASAGTFRCEVSGEAPDFETDYREANMSVIGKFAPRLSPVSLG